MKKLLTVFAVFAMLVCMSCEEEPEKTSPDNIFAGGTWEWKEYRTEVFFNEDTRQIETITLDEIHYCRKISFTDNTFTFYQYQYYPHYENTYTGTYSLSYDSRLIINFVSDEPRLNRSIPCSVGTYGYPEDSIQIIDLDIPGGIYYKIN